MACDGGSFDRGHVLEMLDFEITLFELDSNP